MSTPTTTEDRDGALSDGHDDTSRADRPEGERAASEPEVDGRGPKKPRRWFHRRERERVAPPLPEAIDVVEHHERETAFREMLMQNLVPIGTAVAFAFVITKILLIARGNTSTALTLLDQAGLFKVIGGVLILGLPFISTGLANALGVFAGGDSRLNRFEKRRLWWYFALIVFWLSFVVTWLSTASLLALTAFYAFGAWRRRHPKKPPAPAKFDVEAWLKKVPDDVVLRSHWAAYKSDFEELKRLDSSDPSSTERRNELRASIKGHSEQFNARHELIRTKTRPVLEGIAFVFVVTSMAPLFQNAFNDRPWLPAERIESRDSSAVVGYVLSAGDRWTSVLGQDDRLVTNIKTDSISDRKICAVDGQTTHGTKTIWRVFASDLPGYPLCDSLAVPPPTPPTTASPAGPRRVSTPEPTSVPRSPNASQTPLQPTAQPAPQATPSLAPEQTPRATP